MTKKITDPQIIARNFINVNYLSMDMNDLIFKLKKEHGINLSADQVSEKARQGIQSICIRSHRSLERIRFQESNKVEA